MAEVVASPEWWKPMSRRESVHQRGSEVEARWEGKAREDQWLFVLAMEGRERQNPKRSHRDELQMTLRRWDRLHDDRAREKGRFKSLFVGWMREEKVAR